MLIDAFTYFNEKELAELRIKYLDPIVDYFVVIESNITFTGQPKKWNFPEILNSSLKEFSHKIQYHQLNINLKEIKNEESWIIDDIKGDDFWRIENYQRNYIETACKNFSDDDILIISDLDEIPSKKKLSGNRLWCPGIPSTVMRFNSIKFNFWISFSEFFTKSFYMTINISISHIIIITVTNIQ